MPRTLEIGATYTRHDGVQFRLDDVASHMDTCERYVVLKCLGAVYEGSLVLPLSEFFKQMELKDGRYAVQFKRDI